jgi:hypothetical protein
MIPHLVHYVTDLPPASILMFILLSTPQLQNAIANPSNPSTSSHNRSSDTNDLGNVHALIILRHMLTTCNAQDFHSLVVSKTCEQLWGNEEVLACMLLASNLDHTFVNHTLIAGIHSLIDLIYNTERSLSHRLKRHEVEDRRDRSFATGLTMGVKLL